MDIAGQAYRVYLGQLQQAIAQQRFPNLETIAWQDAVELPPSLLTAIATSSARHVDLYTVKLSDDTCNVVPVPSAWSLTTLRLNMQDIDVLPLRKLKTWLERLVSPCARTLETLVLNFTKLEDLDQTAEARSADYQNFHVSRI